MLGAKSDQYKADGTGIVPNATSSAEANELPKLRQRSVSTSPDKESVKKKDETVNNAMQKAAQSKRSFMSDFSRSKEEQQWGWGDCKHIMMWLCLTLAWFFYHHIVMFLGLNADPTRTKASLGLSGWTMVLNSVLNNSILTSFYATLHFYMWTPLYDRGGPFDAPVRKQLFTFYGVVYTISIFLLMILGGAVGLPSIIPLFLDSLICPALIIYFAKRWELELKVNLFWAIPLAFLGYQLSTVILMSLSVLQGSLTDVLPFMPIIIGFIDWTMCRMGRRAMINSNPIPLTSIIVLNVAVLEAIRFMSFAALVVTAFQKVTPWWMVVVSEIISCACEVWLHSGMPNKIDLPTFQTPSDDKIKVFNLYAAVRAVMEYVVLGEFICETQMYTLFEKLGDGCPYKFGEVCGNPFWLAVWCNLDKPETINFSSHWLPIVLLYLIGECISEGLCETVAWMNNHKRPSFVHTLPFGLLVIMAGATYYSCLCATVGMSVSVNVALYNMDEVPAP